MKPPDLEHDVLQEGVEKREKKSPSTCKIRAPSLPSFQTTIMTLFEFSLISHTKRNTHIHTEPFLCMHSSLAYTEMHTYKRPTVTLSGRQLSKHNQGSCSFNLLRPIVLQISFVLICRNSLEQMKG